MSTAFKVLLSMSVSGGLLILALLLGGRLWRNRLSRQWQYYIWLAVILRLLLPFGPETSLLGHACRAAGPAVTRAAPLPQIPQSAPGDVSAPDAGLEHEAPPLEEPPSAGPLRDVGALLAGHAWLVWLAAALGLLIRKITAYQGFVRYVRAGSAPVCDMDLLDRLAAAAEEAGVRGPVELCVHPLIASPMLLGLFRPCIVLPDTDIPEDNFRYIVLHELTHYRRRDLFYKWLVQATVCLHWFNPLVHLMGREIARACEFSCDEDVLAKLGSGSAQDYGKTLLDAMAAAGRRQEPLGAVHLSGNKQLLKERISAIMSFRRKSPAVRIVTGALTLSVALGAVFTGVYPTAAAASRTPDGSGTPGQKKADTSAPRGTAGNRGYAALAERYYEAGSLPLFEITFPRLDEKTQKEWLEKLYAEGDFAFFSVAVRGLDGNSPLLAGLAEKAYTDEEMAFFSTLADCMDEAELELWLDRALEAESWVFQSILFDKLNRDDEFDELEEKREKELEEAQAAEYRAVGVTMDGEDYYYRGQLVNIFLDIRADKSFYTLNMNPAGAVSIRISRDADNRITGVARMTEAEVVQLLEDMSDDDDDWQKTDGGRIWHPRVIPVKYKTIAGGEVIWLGEYTLSEGDRIWYDVSAETGKGLQIGFAKPGDTHLNTTYYSVKNLRQEDEALECTASFTVKPPARAGTYILFLRAANGALGNVKGSISIGFAAEAS